MARAKKPAFDLDLHYEETLVPAWRRAPWVLRVTKRKGKASPVYIALQRFPPLTKEDTERITATGPTGGKARPRPNPLRERGLIAGDPQRRVLPVIKRVISRVVGPDGAPYGLDNYLAQKAFRGNLPLDDEAGCKLSLICKLQERISEMDRVELIARRIATFTAEEAGYWFSRITNFDANANRWALAGMKTMLGGQPHDPGVEVMLARLQRQQ